MNKQEFTLAEREELALLLVQNRTFTAIANLLIKDKGTISCEVGRDGMNRQTYRAHKAHWHALSGKRRCRAGKARLKPIRN